MLRMAGALYRSAIGSFLSATGRGSVAGSRKPQCCTRAADHAAQYQCPVQRTKRYRTHSAGYYPAVDIGNPVCRVWRGFGFALAV